MEKQPGSWLALISFCTAMVITVALGFGALFAGGSVAVAVAQSSHGSEQKHADNPTQLLPRGSDTRQARAVASQQLKETEESEAEAGKTFAGMITDSRCGARHPMDSGKAPAECARFQAPEYEAEPLQCERKANGGCLADPAGRGLTLSNVDQPAQKRAGRQHCGTAHELAAVSQADAGHGSLGHKQIVDLGLDDSQVRGFANRALHR